MHPPPAPLLAARPPLTACPAGPAAHLPQQRWWIQWAPPLSSRSARGQVWHAGPSFAGFSAQVDCVRRYALRPLH